MTSATLTTRSMAYRRRNRAPLHQRIWENLTAANKIRAAVELHREASLRAATEPVMAQRLIAAARFIEIT